MQKAVAISHQLVSAKNSVLKACLPSKGVQDGEVKPDDIQAQDESVELVKRESLTRISQYMDIKSQNSVCRWVGKYTIGCFIGEEWIYFKKYTEREESCLAREDSCLLEISVDSFEAIRKTLMGSGQKRDASMLES